MLVVDNSPGHPYPLLQELITEMNKTRAKAAAIDFKADFFILIKFRLYVV